jgi:hypothetical protein
MGIIFFILWLSFLKTVVQPASLENPDGGIEVRYEGLLDYEAHLQKPGEILRLNSRQVFTFDNRGNARLDWTIWSEKDTALVPESFLLTGGRIFHRWNPQSPWRELAGDIVEPGRLQILSGMPWLLSGDAVLRGLKLRTRKNRLESVEDLRPHPRLGDVVNWIRYQYANDTIPSKFEMQIHRRDSKRIVKARLTGTSAAPDSLLAAPSEFEPDPSGEAGLTRNPVLVPRAEGVWSLDMEDIDHRSLVVEFADHLAVLEAAVGSANGERMVDAVKQRWPEKPIRYFSFSHHHPHYTGGMRAFIAEGATILTTPGNEEFVRRVARYPFKLSPDRLARSPKRVRIQTFQKRFELADSVNRLVAINIGERSVHTNEFVIFWLPKQKLLFEAEQGWVTVGGKLRAARRAEGFLKILDDEGLEVERLIQCWPMEGNKAEVSRAELEALVLERKK